MNKKHQFKGHYCQGYKQQKPCGKLNLEHCCSCSYQQAKDKAQEYTSYEKIFANQKKAWEMGIQQLKLLRDYKGCRKCGSLAVDAYELYENYENNKLVCQPCLVRKTGSSTSPINFSEQSQWYKKHWGINLAEWLDKHQCLPVNAECARKWLKNKEHLKNCVCLEEESQEIYDLFASSLRKIEEKIKECQCKISNKPRTPYYDGKNYGYTYCEKCEARIKGAGKMGVIKNRNDPKFWGLKVKEKVLCGECLENKKGDMKPLRRAKFNEYKKLERL